LFFNDSDDLIINEWYKLNNYCYCNPSSYNTTEEYELNDREKNFNVDELEVYNVEFE